MMNRHNTQPTHEEWPEWESDEANNYDSPKRLTDKIYANGLWSSLREMVPGHLTSGFKATSVLYICMMTEFCEENRW